MRSSPGRYQRLLTAAMALLARTPIKRLLPPRTLAELRSSINVVDRLDYDGADIRLSIDSTVDYDTRRNSCKKEPDTVAWVESMEAGDVLYDVGANVGAYSLVAAKRFGGDVRVYSFEPAFTNFGQLARNVCLNDCEDTVVTLPIALSNRTEVGQFHYHDLRTGGSRHALGAAVDDLGRPFEPLCTQSVLSWRLDDLVRACGIPAPTHIKIDVDGIELAVLEGADEVLRGGAVRSIMIEAHEGEGERSISEFLEARGFKEQSRQERWTAGMFNIAFVRPQEVS